MSDFTNKTPEDLRKMLTEKRAALRVFRFNVAGSKGRDVKEGMNHRKNIARILTELNAPKNK